VWTLSLDDEGTPRTLSTDPTATNQVHEVHVPSASSDIAFGSWGKSGKRVTAGQAVILGHELCGHAARIEAGTHPADQCQDNGRPDHASTVAIENQIGKELFGPGFEERGSFTDPHQGESFGRFTLTGFNTNRVSAASLPGDMQQRLDHASRILKRPPANHAGCVVAPGADVIGHGDHQGSDASNVTVSTQRAGSVRQALINRGVPASRIKFLTGRGEAECPPCVGPDPDCADPGCRKVEVFVFGFPASSEASP
jgi:outer membrane protein OmpA-like peptidoglycan-associated protein